jgi:hypothetical protein
MPPFNQQSEEGPAQPTEAQRYEEMKVKEVSTFTKGSGGSHPALEESGFSDCVRGSGLGQGLFRIFRLT